MSFHQGFRNSRLTVQAKEKTYVPFYAVIARSGCGIGSLLLCLPLPSPSLRMLPASQCLTLAPSSSRCLRIPTSQKPARDGKTKTSEAIYANGAIYINYNGKWIRSKMTPQDMLKQEQENIRDAKITCRHVRDEMVNGEAAALYMAHSDNDGVKSDAQTWISKSKGLPLKTEEDIDTGDGDKRHMSIRYEYGNVHPPAGVQ